MPEEEGSAGDPPRETGRTEPAAPRPSAPVPSSSLLPSAPVAASPPAPPRRVGIAFDGAFVGPMLPPSPPLPTGAVAPAVTPEVLAIPLGVRDLLRQALDLLTRSDNGLRAASFYIGLMMLVTVAPVIVLFGVGVIDAGAFMSDVEHSDVPTWVLWTLLAAIPAYLGYIAATTEARAMATAVIGGRVEGRPLGLRESIAVSRRRFWRILAVQLIFGVISTTVTTIVSLVLLLTLGPVEFIDTGLSLLITLVISMPFVYAPSGVILGEVGVLDAIGRSIRLVRLRKRLAVVVTLFGVFGQFIVLFGVSAGADLVGRLVVGSGLTEHFPSVLVVPITAALVFALGTLTFLVEAIAAAPAVHAFEALTHYTRGLEVGRLAPVPGRRPWDPWFTKGLALCAAIAMGAMVAGLLSMGG